MDPYVILGLDRTASLEEIRSAYRERAQKYHPDRGGDAWAFKQVQQAFEQILQDRQATNEAPKQQATSAGTPDGSAPQGTENTTAPPFPTLSALPPWAKAVGGSLAGFLLVVWLFGFVVILWGLLAVTLIATVLAVMWALSEKSKEDRKALYVFVGLLGLADVGLCCVIGWWHIQESSQSVAGSQESAISAPDNAGTEGEANKSNQSNKTSSYWVWRRNKLGILVKLVYEKFGAVGVIVAVIVFLYYMYSSKRSK